MNLNVAIVEDNPQYRHSLETLFTHTLGFKLAQSFGSAEAALDAVEKNERWGNDLNWNLVLMDLELPGISGIEATRRLKKDLPQVSVVVLTVFEEPTTILEAISAGADGYLLKRSTAPELLSQLQTIVSGGAPLTAIVARKVLELMRVKDKGLQRNVAKNAPSRLDLTEREQEVLQCLVRGLSYKQCAEHLDVSLDTIRTHIRAVYKKLQVHSVAEAVARAIREKLV
jgi:DNA-binding NarL/FixJ family response regulator